MGVPKKEKYLTQNVSLSIDDYWHSVYDCECSNLINTDNINWIWDTVPVELQYPINTNLSLEWPPKKGHAFRMTAYPYPKTGKSKFWLFTFIKGMSSLLNNTADSVTFPAWQISIYDPLEPNFNSWQKMLENTQGGKFKWNNTIASVLKQVKFLSHEQHGLWLEVTHSCYAPPNCSYPVCDDGGYWLYGCSGSGVFWNCITRKLPNIEGSSVDGGVNGGCLVCNNKIDAMFKLWNYLTVLSDIISPGKLNKYKDVLINSQKISGIQGETILKAEDYLVARLKNTGGGSSLIAAMREIIDSFHKGKQIPKLTAWRSMEQQKSYIGFYTFSIFTAIILTIVGLLIINFVKTIFNTFRGKTPWWKNILNLTILLVTCVVASTIELSILTEFMLTQFGYTTLDMALDKSKLSLKDFIFASAGLDKNYNTLPPGNYNPIANGLAQIQNFDFDLSSLSSISGLDSIIMHTQPNKSGSWAVEILDVRNTPVPPNAKSLDDLIYKLGLCGSPIKSNLLTSKVSSDNSCQVNENPNDLMPPLAKGPIIDTTSSSSNQFIYFGYQPKNLIFNEPVFNNKCDCNDTNIAAQFKADGTLKKCVYCEGTISQQLC